MHIVCILGVSYLDYLLRREGIERVMGGQRHVDNNVVVNCVYQGFAV